jgi:hypothetical protein
MERESISAHSSAEAKKAKKAKKVDSHRPAKKRPIGVVGLGTRLGTAVFPGRILQHTHPVIEVFPAHLVSVRQVHDEPCDEEEHGHREPTLQLDGAVLFLAVPKAPVIGRDDGARQSADAFQRGGVHAVCLWCCLGLWLFLFVFFFGSIKTRCLHGVGEPGDVREIRRRTKRLLRDRAWKRRTRVWCGWRDVLVVWGVTRVR